MILKSGSLSPWLLPASLFFIFFSFFIFSPTPSSLPFSLKQLNQRFSGGWNRKQRCDLSKGRWVRDEEGRADNGYTNRTCKWLPESKNCGKYGKNGDYQRWRWQPERCSLPRFDAAEFFEIVKGKRLAFVGDSVARNQADSLLCLLSQKESPKASHKDPEDRFPTWHFESHSFTLMALWTKFLVQSTERTTNGSGSGAYDLQVDKIDREWAGKLTPADYIVISGGHWFFRELYLHENGHLLGCIYCSKKNTTNLSPAFGLQKAIGTVLRHISEAGEFKQSTLTLLRTFSPSHFENGTWNSGGHCDRARPFRSGEASLAGADREIWEAQVEEMGRIKSGEYSKGVFRRKRFELLDITKSMLMRPDAHPDTNWNNQWMRGYSDCTHWCLPGPIDTWNDMLLALLDS